MNERVEAVVAGRVQMVLYRDFVCRQARALKLTGKVRNVPDGTVRVEAEGPRDKLEELVARLREGPLLARVERVSLTWLPARGDCRSFDICYE